MYAPLSQKSEIKEINGKVVCLVDTDFNALPLEDNFSSETKKKDLVIRRLQIEGDEVNLCRLENLNRSPTEIEESLNAKTFYTALSRVIEIFGDDHIKLIFSNFKFDDSKKFSFIKGDNSIIYPKREFELEGNPSNYKLEVFNFVDKHKEVICNIYCELQSEKRPKWIEDLEKML